MHIDVVYTWVNDQDPAWQAMHRATVMQRKTLPGEHRSVDSPARYANRNELYYSIRSVQKYAPWVRHIYVVTNCTLPDWANGISNLSRVDHRDIFPDISLLPTFSSHAIETCLHRICGLSEHFLYLNDDVFLLQPCLPAQFFAADGGIHYFPSRHPFPVGAASANLRPVDNGAIHACELLERDFGYTPRWKLHHAPFASRRSILAEIEERYSNEVQCTRAQRFRAVNDLPVATTMHAYYAHCTGRGSASTVRARYVDIGDWRFVGLVHPYSPLMRGMYDFLCLNEVSALRHGDRIRNAIVKRVMHTLFA